MTDTTAQMTDRRPDTGCLWDAYGRGSAMLFESAPNAHIDLRRGGSLTLSGEPFVEMNWGVLGGLGEGAAADAGVPGEGAAPGAGDPAADGAALLLCDFVDAILDRRLDAYLMAGAATAPALAPAAARLGLATGAGSPLMARRRTPERVFAIQQEAVTVERVDDDWALRDVAGTLESAFGAPPGVVDRAFAPAMLAVPGLDVFVLRLTGEAASAVVTTRVDDHVGVWAMGTAPGLRLRHLGRRLLEAVIDFHGERPDPPQWFFLTASAMGRHLYDALGFTVVDEVKCIDVPAASTRPA